MIELSFDLWGMGPLVAGGPMVVRHTVVMCKQKIRVYENGNKADI